jgi:NAD(P)-dependent dehydrogenase (short-subunit alcohol dehydrogenase family)
MPKLAGKVAVITGASSGIGFATAKRFATEGAHVFITGRREQRLKDAASAIGSNVTAVQGDAANLADLDRLYATVEGEKGHSDIVFANAGVVQYNMSLGQISVISTKPST